MNVIPTNAKTTVADSFDPSARGFWRAEVMNMIGAVKHVEKALESGVDIICAQGGEGGGHTGEVLGER